MQMKLSIALAVVLLIMCLPREPKDDAVHTLYASNPQKLVACNIADETFVNVGITDEEYHLLARVCMSEAGGKYGESLEGKIAVLETILNRVELGFGTIKEVIYAPNQYSTHNNGEPDSTVYEAVDYVLAHDRLYPRDMLYFRMYDYHKFGKPYKKIGCHYFSTRS